MTAPHRARKRLGQHFLHDPAVIQQILSAIGPRPGDAMVEIGPGLGAITAPLLQILGALDVVELDSGVIAHLGPACAGLGVLRVHHADALKFDFDALSPGPRRLRVVGNLPYNISTPLLFHLIGQLPAIRDMHFLLQLEVVERIRAVPGSKTYGRLSVMVQYHCAARQMFRVGAGAFRPPPRVESAFLRLIPHRRPPALARDYGRFADIVARAFGQRRKMLRTALKGLLSEKEISEAGVDPRLRPEMLGVGDFVALANQGDEPWPVSPKETD